MSFGIRAFHITGAARFLAVRSFSLEQDMILLGNPNEEKS